MVVKFSWFLVYFTVVKCDSPPAVINGKYDESDSYSYREVVQYTCDDGFTMIGSKSITCSKDGRFEPAPPKCTSRFASFKNLFQQIFPLT